MVQMKCHRNRRVNRIFLYSCSYVPGTDLLVLKCGIHEISSSTHESVGKVSSLKDGCASEHLMDLNHGLGLCYCIHIECTLCVVVLVSCVKNDSHRN